MTRVDTQIVGTFTHTLEHKYAGWFRLATATPAGTATYTLDGDAQALITYHGEESSSGCRMDGATLFWVQSGTLTEAARISAGDNNGMRQSVPYGHDAQSAKGRSTRAASSSTEKFN